jgi:hypothetical protein
MKCELVSLNCDWVDVLNVARSTEGKEYKEKEPTEVWKRQILLAEHSPIRLLKVRGRWSNLKYWVSVPLFRHWLGIVHFVTTQRTDRTGLNRDMKTQNAGVNHEFEVNAQALINISRKRLCAKASQETREAWVAFLGELAPRELMLVTVCVPECVYRGFCPEFKSCGYSKTPDFDYALASYRSCKYDEYSRVVNRCYQTTQTGGIFTG